MGKRMSAPVPLGKPRRILRRPARREHARAVRDRSRLPEFLSDAGLLPQEAVKIRTCRFALQKRPPVAQVIKYLEEEIPVQSLCRASCKLRAC